MRYKLLFTNDAEKFVLSLNAKQFRQVFRKILALATNPFPNDSLRLQGSAYYRADQGEYRIVYYIDEQTLVIVSAGKRNDDEVYEALQRQ